MKIIPVRSINASRKEPDLSGNFSIREIRELLDGKDMVQEIHRHDFYYILVLEEGTGKHAIDFTSFEVGKNTLFFMRPGQVHQLFLKAKSTGWLVQFNTSFNHSHDKAFDHSLRRATALNFYQPAADAFKRLLSVLENIFHEYTDKEEGYQDVITANLRILFTVLQRLQTKPLPDSAHSYNRERLEEFMLLLEKQIVEHKQVSYYAGLLHLSPYQLNAITKSIMGKTASTLINDYIILESKRYLLATSSQIKDIADLLGYEDVSYFTRFFRKQTGHTPEAFRQGFR